MSDPLQPVRIYAAFAAAQDPCTPKLRVIAAPGLARSLRATQAARHAPPDDQPAYHPRTALYRRMWRRHRLHHFKNEHYWLGVTTNLGDRILGTFPDPTKVPTSPTCRTLGVESPADGQASPS